MQVDLHGVSHGTYHVLVDEEGLRLISEVGGNPFSAPIVMAPCPCNHEDPPGTPVSLLGFLQ